MARKWIQKAIKHPGALRRTPGTKTGTNIPRLTLESAAKKSGLTGARARFAPTLRKVGSRKKS
jgi:hypothetical protein